MNILIPHTWLLDHLETAATPIEIQKYLSLCGPSIERIYQKEGEDVYDIEVTTNRVDMMSVRGIAREASVILPQFGIAATLKPNGTPSIPNPSAETLPLPAIEDPQHLCRRTYCVVLDQVAQTPTPEWMSKRLRQIDQNIHNSVIDITNYVTHELGHPCHAFDYDKIMQLGGVITISEAQAGVPFTTLDDVTYQTKGGEVVFTNQTGTIIDLPAIKGTANTAVDSQTKRVLLWIESIPAAKIRAASMSHAIRTVAAQLNEKNVDPHLAEPTLARGVQLYQQLCQAQVSSQVYDAFPDTAVPQTITVPLHYITAYLGMELATGDLTHILETLGCQVSSDSDVLKVTPPTFRPDLVIPADVIEEIARIYGYHRLPSVLMPTAIPTTKPAHTTFVIEQKMKQFLAGQGWQEVYTYSMVSEQLASASGYSLSDHLKIANPLTEDRVYLRRSLLPSLSEVLATNPLRPTLSVFEIAATYVRTGNDIPSQVPHLALVSNRSYRDVRGILEAMLSNIFVGSVTLVPDTTPAPGFTQSATVTASTRNNNETIGLIGVLPQGLIGVQLKLDAAFLSITDTHPHYTPIPKSAPTIEDLTFTIPETVPVGSVLKSITAISPLVSQVDLTDTYQRNFTFSVTYWAPDKTLSATDLEPLRKKLVQNVQLLPGVKLIGNV